MEKLTLKHVPKNDHKRPAEIELERLERRLRTVQLAVEILTGVSATLPDLEPEPEGEDAHDGMHLHLSAMHSLIRSVTLTLLTDEMDEDEDAMSDDDDEGEVEQPRKPTPSALPTIVEPLLALIQPTPLSFPPTSGGASPHPPTTSALSAIHICALECLNNIFLSLATPARLQSQGFASDADREAGPRIWAQVWRALGDVGTDVDGSGQERRREVWQIAAGVLWGVAILWKGTLVSRRRCCASTSRICFFLLCLTKRS